jgi:hypothetical protein
MDAQDKPLIMILVKRAAIFAFTICAVSIFYWIVGSASSFLDETQSMLLGVMRVSSLGIVATSVIGLLLGLVFALARRYRLRALGVAGYAFAGMLGVSALYLAQSVIILSRGLR